MKIISIIGSGNPDDEQYSIAEEVGREIALKKHALACGGLGGVMEAACKGARESGGLTIGIIPGESKEKANKYIDIPIVTGSGHARNLTVALTGDVIIAIGGSYGTLSEISFALIFKKKIIGINTWDVSPEIESVASAREAVDLACRYLDPEQ